MRLIDADALIKEIFEHCRSEKECLNHFWFDENLISLVDNAPTIKDRSLEIAQKSIELGRKVGQLEGKLERPQGEWIEDGYRDLPCVCSYCGEVGNNTKYCPNCGAEMKKGGTE